MEPLQTIGVLLLLLVLATAPVVYQWAYRSDAADLAAEQDEDTLPEVMTPVQALARTLYGEACGWDNIHMLNYDGAAWVREPWERSARARLGLPPKGNS